MPALRVGIVGLGFGGKVHLPAFMSIPHVTVGAVCSSNASSASQIARSFGVPEAYSNWRDLVSAHNIDAVSVAVPPAAQYEIVSGALAAGKHVLCEKPFGLHLREASGMVEAAKHRNVTAAVGFQFRMEPGISELRRKVKSGEVGTVRRLHVVWLTRGASDPNRPWSWQNDISSGGGVLTAFGSHVIDYVQWITGSHIQSIVTDTEILTRLRNDNFGKEKQVTAEDSCNFICRLVNGIDVIAAISNCCSTGLGHSIEVYGDLGRLRFFHAHPFDAPAQLVYQPIDGDEHKVTVPDLPGDASDTRTAAFRELARIFVESIEERSCPDLPTFSSGLEVREVLEAARQSLQLRKWACVERNLNLSGS